MKRKDFTQTAFDIVQQATGEAPKVKERPKSAEAAEMGRKGGLKGGVARKAALSPARRKAIASAAATSRWKKPK